MGAQEQPFAVFVRIEEERVVHLARRMAFREVQRGEIQLVGLDVRAFGDGKAHVGEDRGQFVDHLADRVDAAGLRRRRPQRQGDVDGLAGKARLQGGLGEHVPARGDGVGDLRLQAVERRSHDLSLLRGHLAERLHLFGDPALLAEGMDADLFQGGFGFRAIDGGEEIGFESFEI
jgi:hypothetical protein